MTTDIAFSTASELIEAFRTGKTTPSEVLAAQLKNIENDVQLSEIHRSNAITELIEGVAEEAEQATEAYRVAQNNPEVVLPPLLGLTIAVRPDQAEPDHPLNQRLTEAGAIVHAHTAAGQDSAKVRNPWDARGSITGSAAVLAAGMSSLATCADTTGGSRISAAAAQQVAYVPPRGRIATQPGKNIDWYRTESVLGYTVEDVALLAAELTGMTTDDVSTVPGLDNLAETRNDLSAATDWFAGRKIGYSATLGDFELDPAIEAAFNTVLETLEKAGAELVEIQPEWNAQWITTVAQGHFELLGPRAMLASMQLGQLLEAEADIQQKLAAAIADVDVLVTPVSTSPNLPSNINPEATWADHLTLPFNIAARHPVLTTPLAHDDLRIGIQWVGHPFAEASVFKAGATWQHLAPWVWQASR